MDSIHDNAFYILFTNNQGILLPGAPGTGVAHPGWKMYSDRKILKKYASVLILAEDFSSSCINSS